MRCLPTVIKKMYNKSGMERREKIGKRGLIYEDARTGVTVLVLWVANSFETLIFCSQKGRIFRFIGAKKLRI
jgi:hypothetical protein